jgi:hypothetical protein
LTKWGGGNEWSRNNGPIPLWRHASSLPKLFHNGFQERVFSHGTYKDDKLKKRVTDEILEMKVFDSLNSTKCMELLNEINLQRSDDNNARYVEKIFAFVYLKVPTMGQVSQEEEEEGSVIEEERLDEDLGSDDDDDEFGFSADISADVMTVLSV